MKSSELFPFARARFRVLVGLIVATSAGCRDEPQALMGPPLPLHPFHNLGATRSIATLDDALRRIEELVPGFGGLYVNDDNELVIRLRDSSRALVAPQAVMQMLGRIPGRRGAPIRIQPATYAFSELQGWMREILRSVNPNGVLEADIDERDNRVFLGVEDAGVAERIRAELTRLGIPGGAVALQAIRLTPKLSANDSLTSVSTPVVGGVMIQTRNEPQGGSKPHCTGGFNAWLLPDTLQLYMVINDHCTWQMGGVTGDTLWQSHYDPVGASTAIAIEVASAQYRAMSDTLCWTGYLCRYSDAALFRYFSSSQGAIGEIARPLWYSQGSTAFTLLRDTAEFHITGDLPRNRLTVQGEWMSKVGVTTGWSAGRVSDTCILRTESGKWLVCQFNVDDVMGVGADFVKDGDSGSPAVRTVWSEDDEYDGTNWLAGIVHAGGPGPGGVYQFTASDINLLYLDLGQLKTYRGPTCIPDPYYWGCQ